MSVGRRTWPMRACSRPVQEASQASRRSCGWRVSSREARSESGCGVSAMSASLRSVGSVSSELVGASPGFGPSDSPFCTCTHSHVLASAHDFEALVVRECS